MSEMKSRRELGLLVTGGVMAASAIVGSKPALAEPQPEMHRARDALYNAIQLLRAASDDKGGHKIKAIDLIERAISEVDAGMRYDNRH